MTIEERAAHLTNLITLMEYHERLGGPRNRWILAEWNYHNDLLMQGLKENYDENANRKTEGDSQ